MNSNHDIALNVANAFQVVLSTYKSVDKLIHELDGIAAAHGFSSISPKFLRWKSDNEIPGWFITDFIKLYMREEASVQEASFSGPVYSVEISLNEYQSPKVIVAKYFYSEDEGPRTFAVSPGDHWKFNHPVSNKNRFNIISWENKWFRSTPLPSAGKSFMGLQCVIFTHLELMDIQSSQDVDALVFETMDELIPMQI